MLIVGSPAQASELVGSGQTLESEDIERHGYTDSHHMLRQIPGVNIHEEGFWPFSSYRDTRYTAESSRITLMEDGVLMAPAVCSAPSAYYFPPVLG